MANSIIVSPARIERALYGSDGVTQYSPGLAAPSPVTITPTGWLVVALTPTGTTVTIAHVGDESVPGCTITGATARINGSGGTTNIGSAYLVRAWARRKPGATGAIAAQKIILKSWDGSAQTEIGRLYVSAVAAGTDEPVSDVVPILRTTADTLIEFGLSNPFNIVFESADSDLELVIEAYGN